MKRKLLLTALLAFALSIAAQENNKEKNGKESVSMEEFFTGQWKLLVEGMPQGDAEMLLVIEKKDGKLQGTFGGMNGEAITNLTKVKIEGKTLTVNFMGGGWDVPMYLDKEKDGTISGNMNDMFDVTGKKIVEE